MDVGAERLTGEPLLLVCGHVPAGGADATVVDELCRSPLAAARALRAAGATRAALGLCDLRAADELRSALRRVGAEPFGVEAVDLGGSTPAEAERLLAGARARLRALEQGATGKPVVSLGRVSRRGLFALAPLRAAPTASVDAAACSGSRACGICADACPQDAILLAGPTASVDERSCDGCGRCVPACPTGALRLAGSSTAQIEAQLDALLPELTGVVFACRNAARAPAPAGWARVELASLRLVTAGWALQLAAEGVDIRLARCDGPCCAGLAELPLTAPFAVEPTGSVRLAEPRATVDAVLRLDRAGVDVEIPASASPLGIVGLDPGRCTLCGACATACPAGALALEERADETALRYDPARCVACGRCADVCPEGAVLVEPGLDIGPLREGARDLAASPAERCRGCGEPLPPVELRRRIRALLPALAGTPVDLCAGCAGRTA